MMDSDVILPMMRPFASLLQKENHIWHINPKRVSDVELVEYCYSILSTDEKIKLSRFHFKGDRHEYLLSHAFVRNVLSQYSSIDPASWEFSIEGGGRPRVSNEGLDGKIEFNLSHTAGLTVCLVSVERVCGIDAEAILPKKGLLEIARQMFSPANYRNLISHYERDSRQFLQCFYSQWVLREACVKATGAGIGGVTGDMVFEVTPKGNIMFRGLPESEIGKEWSFELLDISPQHCVAVAQESDLARKKNVAYAFSSLIGEEVFSGPCRNQSFLG